MSWVNLRLKVSRCAQHCVIQSLRVSSRGSDLKWHRTYYCIYWVFSTFMLTTRKVSGMLHSSVVERCTRGLQHIPLVPVSITQGTYFQRMRRLNFGIVSRGMWRKTALFDLLKIRAEQGIPVCMGAAEYGQECKKNMVPICCWHVRAPHRCLLWPPRFLPLPPQALILSMKSQCHDFSEFSLSPLFSYLKLPSGFIYINFSGVREHLKENWPFRIHASIPSLYSMKESFGLYLLNI